MLTFQARCLGRLLRRVLRQKWGLNWLITSDCAEGTLLLYIIAHLTAEDSLRLIISRHTGISAIPLLWGVVGMVVVAPVVPPMVVIVAIVLIGSIMTTMVAIIIMPLVLMAIGLTVRL